jgi:CubicO group peptidase (beta-lactamase class C family)
MRRTGVPGVAVAVVHNDAVVYAKGFGVRELGQPGRVDANTVFQVASVSKPISATVVARAVGRRVVAWDEPVVRVQPSFALSNPYATRNVTIADLLSHRSGLPDHIGDVLEDLGMSGAGIIQRLRFAPLGPLRQAYVYTNFGFSAAAYAVARKLGQRWSDLAQRTLYGPLGMSVTSSRYSDFRRRTDRTTLHVQRSDGSWVVGQTRDPDAQMPAGGVSSSVLDLTRWMRLLLDGGVFGGRRLIAPSALWTMLTPIVPLRQPVELGTSAAMSGLGINVQVDDTGRVRYSHSGGFKTGASTTVTMVPAERLGIVVLTNGWPVGLPEAVANDFMDLAEQGRITRDWLALIAPHVSLARNPSRLAGRSRPRSPRPARPAPFYAGTYRNDFYGQLMILARRGRLTLVLGPRRRRFTLSHWSGDTYSFNWNGENEYGISAVDFRPGRAGRARSVRLELLDVAGLGTFRRR